MGFLGGNFPSKGAGKTGGLSPLLSEFVRAPRSRAWTVEPQPGLHFRRHSTPTEQVHGFYEPAFCVIAQGSKNILLGENSFRYDPAHYLISTVKLPLIGQVVDASPERPCLGFRLVLDPSVVMSVMVESCLAQPRGDDSVKAVDVSPLDANLLDATLRLVRLDRHIKRVRRSRAARRP
jgi:hypothetical protein